MTVLSDIIDTIRNKPAISLGEAALFKNSNRLLGGKTIDFFMNRYIAF